MQAICQPLPAQGCLHQQINSARFETSRGGKHPGQVVSRPGGPIARAADAAARQFGAWRWAPIEKLGSSLFFYLNFQVLFFPLEIWPARGNIRACLRYNRLDERAKLLP